MVKKLLSLAGKLVLMKSVLFAMPSHAMTCFKLSVSLCKRIQSAVTRFWWDDNTGKKKMVWVSWDKLTQPKSNGGVGFHDFQCYNDAFLAKISWRLIHKPHSLLGRILLGKYCQDANMLSVQHKAAKSHGWRGILIGRDLIAKNSGWLVGDGQSIELWMDAWLDFSRGNKLIGLATQESQGLKVSPLLNPETADWDCRKIHEICPNFNDQILKIKPSKSGAPDKLI